MNNSPATLALRQFEPSCKRRLSRGERSRSSKAAVWRTFWPRLEAILAIHAALNAYADASSEKSSFSFKLALSI